MGESDGTSTAPGRAPRRARPSRSRSGTSRRRSNAVLAGRGDRQRPRGLRLAVLQEIIQVSGAACAVRYLPSPTGSSLRDRARRSRKPTADRPRGGAARGPGTAADLPLGRSADADGQPLRRKEFSRGERQHPARVLRSRRRRPFARRPRAPSRRPPRKTRSPRIAPSLAVALANASANERVRRAVAPARRQNSCSRAEEPHRPRTAQELQRASALKDRFLASCRTSCARR